MNCAYFIQNLWSWVGNPWAASSILAFGKALLQFLYQLRKYSSGKRDFFSLLQAAHGMIKCAKDLEDH